MVFKFFKKRSPKVVKREDKVTINEKEACRLQELEPGNLLGKEITDWGRVKEAVEDINIYVTEAGFVSFLEQVIFTGKTEDFIGYLNQVSNQTTKDYILYGRKLISCKMKCR